MQKYYGGCLIKGDDGNTHEFFIINKDGITLEELSYPSSKYYIGNGKKKAIEQGESADLIDGDFIPYYKKLGRNRFIEVLKEHRTDGRTSLLRVYRELVKKMKYGKS